MQNKLPNEQYNVASADSLAVKIAGYQRRRMFERFMAAFSPTDADTLLDVGVTAERSYPSSNYFEKWFPYKPRVTAVGLHDARFLEEEFPGMRFVRADGRALPFKDRAFDFVHSSAVIEHVGSLEQQARLIAECARVARRGFFITTPNRWFPMEFHTVTPFLHWLPPKAFRAVMRRLGRDFFAQEANLNLMSKATMWKAVQQVGVGDRFKLRIGTVGLGGWPSNLLLIGAARTNDRA